MGYPHILHIMKVYYHVTPSPNVSDILDNGLKPTEATECSSGVGIHVVDDLVNARQWGHTLRAEREDFETEYTILEITVDGNCPIIDDEFVGTGPIGAVVLCLSEPVHPTKIEETEWLY